MKVNLHGYKKLIVPIMVLVLASLIISTPALAREIRVPEDYDNIEDAVGDAGAGDVIIVGPGTYAAQGGPNTCGTANGTLDLNVTDLTLKSRDGADVTVLRCQVQVNERGVKVEGFTIRPDAPNITASPADAVIVPNNTNADRDVYLTDLKLRLTNSGDGVYVNLDTNLENYFFTNLDIRPQAQTEAASAQKGIEFTSEVTSVENVWIDGPVIRGLGGHGIYLHNTSDTETLVIKNGEIVNVGSVNPGGHGIYLHGGGDLNNAAIRNMLIQLNGYNTTGHGIYVSDSMQDIDPFDIIGNTIVGNADDGLHIENSGDIEILNVADNFFDANENDNIDILNGGDGDDWTFSCNVVNRAGSDCSGSDGTGTGTGGSWDDGIHLHPSGELDTIVFSENELVNNYCSNIRINNDEDLMFTTFENNDVLEARKNNGISIYPGGDVEHSIFSGNAVRDNDDYGIKIDPGSDADVTHTQFINGNDISRNGMSGVLIDVDDADVRDVLVDTNTFRRNGTYPQTGSIRTHGIWISSIVLAAQGTTSTPIIDEIQTESSGTGDIINVTLKNNDIFENFDDGARIHGDDVRDINVLDNPYVADNGDHGVYVESEDTLSMVTVTGNTITGSDRDRDNVGTNLLLTSEQVINAQVVVANNTLSYGYRGLLIAGQDYIGPANIYGNTINCNETYGIDIDGEENITGVTIGVRGITLNSTEDYSNVLLGNGTGIRVSVLPTENSTDIVIEGNRIDGSVAGCPSGCEVDEACCCCEQDKFGNGIELDAKDVTITKNDIRDYCVGILVKQCTQNQAYLNNISNNDCYGLQLAPGITPPCPPTDFQAQQNFWGEPSGPTHTTNPGGMGDRVSDGVDYSGFLTSPAVPTAAQFVGTLSASATQINAGETVTFSIGVQNEGDAEGVLQVTFEVKDSAGKLVHQTQKQITVNPQGTKTEDLQVLFSEDGTYTATLDVEGGVSPSPVTIQVGVGVVVEWPPVWADSGLQPSPVISDTATLHIEGAFDSVTLMVFDLSGAKVLEKAYTTNDEDVDLAELDNGVFLYVLMAKKDADTSKSEVKKLLVQK